MWKKVNSCIVVKAFSVILGKSNKDSQACNNPNFVHEFFFSRSLENLLRGPCDNNLFRWANKNKDNAKLLWFLVIVKLRIPGFIWRGTANMLFKLTRLAKLDELRASSYAGRRDTFWGINMEAKYVLYFSLFTTWYGFWNFTSFFVNS